MNHFLRACSSVLLSTCLMSVALAQNPTSPNHIAPKMPAEPMWVRVARVPEMKMTVYYDITSLERENGFARGIVMYEPDEPIEEYTDLKLNKKTHARVMSLVVNCRELLFAVIQVQVFDVKRPNLMTVPFYAKTFDPPMVRPMTSGSSMHGVFCPIPKNSI